MPMTVAMVVLEYDCGVCHRPIAATLRCEGEFESAEVTVCVAAALKCPHCDRISDVVFDPSGDVHQVTGRPRPVRGEPNWN